MAERFNLTAQLQLQAPRNTAQVVNQIRKDLGNLGVNVKIQGDARSLAAITGQLKSVDKTAQRAAGGMNLLNRNIAEAARRFSVITVATGSFIALTRSIKNSVGAAIEFEREMIKISQVTGTSVSLLSGLSGEVTRLSTTLGVANQSLLETARILSQAGLNALKTKQALQILANTTLAPTFDNIIDTTEGAIAIINQFGREASKVGKEIQFLEQALDAINSVSKSFAVESKDLITAVRRVGGVFEAAGGKINELIALFTSVRQTTRESAETIATGFRTIFTRLQRSETLDALKELGIQLSDTEGKFIGPLKAIEALSVGLAGLDPRDVRFNEIVEQLGGFRQIGKVIPLIKQYAVAENALSVANKSAGSTAEDAQTAQKSLAVQFQKVGQQFDALIRKFADSETFRGLATTVIKLAEAFLKFAESLEVILPQLTLLAGIKLGRALAPGLVGLFGGKGRQFGGVVHGFAGGGFVPGKGNRDTVPAMLTPGEFVIKKRSAKKLGADQLAAMNKNRYAKGGKLAAAKLNHVVDGDSLNIAATPEGKPFNTSSRLIGYDAYELHSGTNDEKALGQKAKKMAESHYRGRMSVFGLFKDQGKDKYGRPMYKDDEFGRKMMRARPPVATLYGGTGQRATQKKKKKKAFGGLIQRFAMGGIAQAKKVGAAILDPDAAQKDDTVSVTVNELNKKFPKFRDLKKGASPISSLYKATNFAVQREGLSQATSTKFQNALNDGLVAGTDIATAALAQDLGTSSGKMAMGSKQNFIKTVRPAIRGDLFEAALLSMNNAGTFDTALDPSRPFDFPGGLRGGLKDNFPTLPSEYVDAKSSYAAASTSNMKGKIVSQLVQELKAAGVESMATGTKSAKAAKAAKAASAPTTNAKGGSISGTDSVPSLLTPGEFVVNKSSAQAIGYSKLHKMNQTGVAGFAEGGLVGFQRFAGGGEVGVPETRKLPMRSGDEMAEMAVQADALAADLKAAGTHSRSVQKALLVYKQAILKGKSAGEALNKAWDEGRKHSQDLDKEMENLLKSYAEGGISEGELTKATDDLTSRMTKRTAAGPPSGGGPGGPGRPLGGGGPPSGGPPSGGGDDAKQLKLKGIQQKFDKLGSGLGKVQSGLSRLSTGLIGLSFIAGTLIQSSNSLSDAQKEQEQAGINSVAAFGAVGAEVASFGVSMAAQIATMISANAAKAAEAAANKAAEQAALAAAGGSAAAQAGDEGEAVASVMAAQAEQAEAAATATAARADAEEAVATAAATRADAEEAATTAAATRADATEATVSAQAARADAEEAVATAAASRADADEAASSLTSARAEQTEATATATAAKADAEEAVATAAATKGDAEEAITTAAATRGDAQEAAVSAQAARADAQEATATAAATKGDLNEAASSAWTTKADADEAIATAAATRADAEEAIATAAATRADAEEAAASAQAARADATETGGSAAATKADEAEALSTAAAAKADEAEATASAVTTKADAQEATASGLSTKADAQEAVASALADKSDLQEAVATSLATRADAKEAAATALATRADSHEAIATMRAAKADEAEALSTAAAAKADEAEAVATAAAAKTDEAEALATVAATKADEAEATASAATTKADAQEAAASGLSTKADAQEAAASGLSTKADAQEAVATSFATRADASEAAATGLAAVADLGEGVASGGATIADIGEAIASGAAAAAAWVLATAATVAASPLILLGIVVAAVVAAFAAGFLVSIYKTAKAVKAMEQSIEKFNAVADKELDKLQDTGVGNEETFVKGREGAAVTEFNKEVLKAGAGMRNMKVGATAASFALAGAAIGATITAWLGPGALLGAAIGAVVGGLIGLAVAGSAAESAMERAVTAELSQAAKVAHISNLYATTTWRSVQAIQDFDRSLSIAKEANLSASDTLGIMVKGQQNLVSEFEASANRLKHAKSQGAELQTKLEGQGLVTAGGTETGIELDDEDEMNVAKKDLAQLKEINKQKAEAQEKHNDVLKKIYDDEAKIRAQIAQGIGELISKISKGGEDAAGGKLPELSSIKSVKALLAVDKEFEKHYNNAIAEIRTKLKLELDASLEGEKNKGVEDALRAQHAARLIAAEQGILVNAGKRLLAEQKAIANAIRTELVERAKQKAINDVNTTLKGFNNVLLGATETAKGFAAIDSAIATANFQAAEVATIDPTPLQQPLAQIDRGLLDKALEQGVKGITLGTTAGEGASPADKEIQDRANRMKTTIQTVHTVIKTIPEIVLDLEPIGSLGTKEAENQLVDIFNQINQTVDGKLGEIVGERDSEGKLTGVRSVDTSGADAGVLGTLIQDGLRDLFDEGGTPSSEGVQKMLSELEDVIGPTTAAFEKGIEIQNQYITKMAAVNAAIIDQQGKYAEALGRVESVTEKAADRLAKAQGQPRDRFVKELGRRRVAQARLGDDPKLAGVAGDVGKTADALRELDKAAKDAAEGAKTAIGFEDKKKFNDANALAAAGAKKAARELERLADQSARAADIEGELNKVRAARKQVGAIAESFAFGSDEERFDMGEAFNQLNIATGQGGIQGFDEDQRKQVGGLLDQLSDVQIGNTGKTGRQLKAQFAEQEALAQGMDPAMAKQIGDAVLAGSQEEQLLDELKRLGQEEKAAADALASRVGDQVTILKEIRDKLEIAFPKDMAAGQAAAAAADERPEQAAKEEALREKLKEAQAAVTGVATELVELETALAKTTAAILESTNQLTDAKKAKTQGGDLGDTTGRVRSKDKGLDAAQQTERNEWERNNPGEQMSTYQDAEGKMHLGEDPDLTAMTSGRPSLGTQQKARDRGTAIKVADIRERQLGGEDVPMPASLAPAPPLPSGRGAREAAKERRKNEGSSRLEEEEKRKEDSGYEDMTYMQKRKFNRGRASGGMVYRADGGSIFQSRGTDTVPAMLTPGEFVIRKSAVDKIGAGNLATLNRGTGDAVYRAGGGPIGIPQPGFVRESFSKLMQTISPKDLIGALESGEGHALSHKEAVKAYRAMKMLNKGGKLNPSMLAGLVDIEDLLKILQSSHSIRGIGADNTVDFKPPDLGRIEDVSPDFPPSKEDRHIVKEAMTRRILRIGDLITTSDQMKDIYETAQPKGMNFVSSLLQEYGGVKGNFAESLKMIQEQVVLEKDVSKLSYAVDRGVGDTDNDAYWSRVVTQMGKSKARTGRLEVARQKDEKKKKLAVETTKLEEGMSTGELNALATLKDLGILRFAQGGNVAGADKVPAMLTPGEFVMSPEAVQKHGVGFMKNLNRGQVPGFRRGGSVGGVAYRNGGSNGAEGGGSGMTIGLDITGIQGVFDNFNAQFATNLDNVVAYFSDMTSAMNTLAGAMGKGMVFTHQFTGDLALAFKIDNADVLKKTIADAIIPHISKIINDHIESELHKKFRTEE